MTADRRITGEANVLLGFSSMNTRDEVPLRELAAELETRGFESIWVGEHSHIPARRQTPYPRGGELPDPYRRMMDPYIGLAIAAAATVTLKVGTGATLPLERDIFELAKTVSTLDQVSGGRLAFGVGVGWNREELADHQAIPWSKRYLALRECITALRTLWTDDEAQYHGTYYDFEPVWSFPKPAQVPLPVWCGMSGPLGMREAATWGDGWMPIDAALGDVRESVQKFRRMLEDCGRDPATVPISIVAFGDPSSATLDSYAALGAYRVVIDPGRAGWDDATRTRPFIDRYAELIKDLA
jgi:probable F420-dependent oxidoreductase